MSYQSWHNYGYGICADDIGHVPVERLQALIRLVPELEKQINSWLQECEITKPEVGDYFEYDNEYHGGFATILQWVIKEAEGIELLYCDDLNGKDYLIYPPQYPWQITDADRDMTEERLRTIYAKYVSILTDRAVAVDYQSVENGG